jgi:glycosyltransferase involved in cell wall biosynthesis
VDILLDYRPALRHPTGVGEYAHELAGALSRALGPADTLRLFTSSWSDRPPPALAADWPGTTVIDRRWPVRPLAFAWHRLGLPKIETLAGAADIVQSLHPLLIPTRRALQAITIHDLDFLAHRERTSAEIHRDYGVLVRSHARRAALVVVNSADTAGAVRRELSVPDERLVICRPGVPAWIGAPVDRRPPPDGYVLFVGTLEPRKNLGALLDAWEALTKRGGTSRLRIAGSLATGGEGWLTRLRMPPLARSVDYAGYVGANARRALYEGARLLVLPSHHEGFGLPALEAMALGVPVVASNRGALPEVVGNAGILVDPGDSRALADAIQAVLDNPARAETMSRQGLTQAARFTWAVAASDLYDAYRRLLEREVRDARRR